MAKHALTLEEARDHVLKRLNAESSSEYETLVLELLNRAQTFVSASADWEYLRKKATITFGAATPLITFPSDCDRILSFHKTGSKYWLRQLDPQLFEMTKEDTSVDEPMFWCVLEWWQSDTDVPPIMRAEVYAEPSNGDAYTLWYIKSVNELATVNLASVPALPLHIWDLIIHKATLEGLKQIEAPDSKIRTETQHFEATLNQYKRREDYGSTHRDSIAQRPDLKNYYASRMR